MAARLVALKARKWVEHSVAQLVELLADWKAEQTVERKVAWRELQKVVSSVDTKVGRWAVQ
jgi:capsid protein